MLNTKILKCLQKIYENHACSLEFRSINLNKILICEYTTSRIVNEESKRTMSQNPSTSIYSFYYLDAERKENYVAD